MSHPTPQLRKSQLILRSFSFQKAKMAVYSHLESDQRHHHPVAGHQISGF
jgi:hypothetical protein